MYVIHIGVFVHRVGMERGCESHVHRSSYACARRSLHVQDHGGYTTSHSACITVVKRFSHLFSARSSAGQISYHCTMNTVGRKSYQQRVTCSEGETMSSCHIGNSSSGACMIVRLDACSLCHAVNDYCRQ
jgi:hypothetical protein